MINIVDADGTIIGELNEEQMKRYYKRKRDKLIFKIMNDENLDLAEATVKSMEILGF